MSIQVALRSQEYLNPDYCFSCAYFQHAKGHFGSCRDKKDGRVYDGTKRGSACVLWRKKSDWSEVDYKLQEPPVPIKKKLVRSTHAWWKKAALGSVPQYQTPMLKRMEDYEDKLKAEQRRATKGVRNEIRRQIRIEGRIESKIRRSMVAPRPKPIKIPFAAFWRHVPRPRTRLPFCEGELAIDRALGQSFSRFWRNLSKPDKFKKPKKIHPPRILFPSFWKTIESESRREEEERRFMLRMQAIRRANQEIDAQIKVGLMKAFERLGYPVREEMLVA